MGEEYKRFTVSLPEDLYNKFEEFRKKFNISRSDGIRKAMTKYMITEESIPNISGDVVGCITMVISHEHFDSTHEHIHHATVKDKSEETEHEHPHIHDQDHKHAHDQEHLHEHDFKSKPIYASVQQADLLRNNDIQHHFFDVIKSTMHIHLEFEKCLEIIAVSGPLERVKKLKEALQSLKSVLSIDFFVVDKK